MCNWPALFDAYWCVNFVYWFDIVNVLWFYAESCWLSFCCDIRLFIFGLCMMRFSKNLGNQDYSRLSSLALVCLS